MKAFRYQAQGHNPYENLAIEEFFTNYVTEHAHEQIAILYFWQNEDCVVFGRNQNVASECNLTKLQQWGVHPVRRKTGGGAVFHDVKNLNFTFVVSKALYDKDISMQILQDALQQMGIPATINGRNDILLHDAKISGSAYSGNEAMALHHGTLLLSVDMDKLEQLLTVDTKKLASKGVKSVRSRVRNLMEKYPQFNVEDYESAIQKQFCNCYHIEELQPFAFSQEDWIRVKELTKQYASEQWIFGHDLHQLRQKKERFSWGSCILSQVAAPDGTVYYHVYSDTLQLEAFEQVKRYLQEDSGKEDRKQKDTILETMDGEAKAMLQDVLTLYEALEKEERQDCQNV